MRRACAVFAAFLAIGVLALVVISVFLRGIKALNLDFFTKSQVTFGETGGGIANGLVGTAIMVAIATAIALPVGILVAVYVAEFGGSRVSRLIRLALDVLNGVPSIVVGIFAYALLVVGSGYAAWKGSVALAIIMLPVVARSTIEVLGLVPDVAPRRQLRARHQQVADGALHRDAVGDRLDHDRRRRSRSPGPPARRRRSCSRRRSSCRTRS